jgi:hypothetical protein
MSSVGAQTHSPASAADRLHWCVHMLPNTSTAYSFGISRVNAIATCLER